KDFSNIVEMFSFFNFTPISAYTQEYYENKLISVLEEIENDILDNLSNIEKRDIVTINNYEIQTLIVNGIDITNDFSFVQNLKDKFNSDFSILQLSGSGELVRVNTTVSDSDGNSIRGTTLYKKSIFYSTIIEEAKDYIGFQRAFDKTFFTIFRPYFSEEKEFLFCISFGYEIEELIEEKENNNIDKIENSNEIIKADVDKNDENLNELITDETKDKNYDKDENEVKEIKEI
ncbi:MAG: cache domain-containing protein, partial [Exilispira sp.]